MVFLVSDIFIRIRKKYHGLLRINKTKGGKFCIKIPTSKTGSDYVVVTKYKTTDMDEVEQKDSFNTF
ncbi:Uncharacterized protein FWK35_00028624 [Aphis craccivora]|uniref:Uncharacterized protein n=1 Tax=Aphis craccivora TaxID=307492 RepID=A0A6G0VW13_APHCR|nr:Uncharacterized protein FWK35_00028624 [Aphis craccivora]